ncbi:MAG: 4'-phosphopantetheinyl transferase superfamily protein [Bacteroidetes bacterium]|nr:4'-phosphopantetheinyl transferase superfamily protein [Bacteroidota bacterium]
MIHQLGFEEVHIWKIESGESALLEQCQSILSKEELEKTDFFKFKEARIQYIISQGVLRILLANYLKITPQKVNIGRKPKGKPYSLDDKSLFFNMSNSEGLCVFAFSRESEVGIDVEKKRKLADLQDMINRNFTASEIQFIKRNPEEELERFFRFWTIKEAYLKAIGEGMRLTPDKLEFTIDRNTVKLLSREGIFEFEDWVIKEFKSGDDFVGTIVYQNANCKIIEKFHSLL